MADLAIAFHWALPDMLDFSLSDLAQWRERARARFERDDD